MKKMENNSHTAAKEIEYKFENRSNTQFKFNAIESNETMLQKVRMLCKLLDIGFGDPRAVELTDEYFDNNNALRQVGGSLRRRRQDDGSYLITLKVGQKQPVGNGLHRLEDEFEDPDEFESLISDPNAVSRRFRENLNLSIEFTGRFEKTLTVTNRRTLIPLKTKVAEYKFCYDVFYYYYDNEGQYTENYAEIEIELEGQELPHDPQLDRFREATKVLLNYTVSQKSKLQRGLDRLEGRDEGIEIVHSAALDIVEYTKKPGEVQKQIIQQLNHLAKKAISGIRGRGAERDVIYLPTGDGMIMVFKDGPDTLPPIIINIQEEVKRHNSTQPENRRFEFRTGLHSGPVFKYSDVNGNNNFAGNGINLAQRVMSLGEKWHILATREAHEAMGKTRSDLGVYFHPVGMRKIKHGDELEVFNVYDQTKGCGNPIVPSA
jgi:class 3 adenylate cyclase